MKVILADDSVLILERLQEMVSAHKQMNIVGSYTNGIRTLDALRRLKPDLAIIDIKMPGLSGLEVLSEIRKENKEMLIIILTFFSIDYYRQLAMQDGANYFFSKIDDFEKLAAVVADLANKDDADHKPDTDQPPIMPVRNTG
jgi:DNA-binding NarL/FixJ family response regulator